jgi:hypothetical protein
MGTEKTCPSVAAGKESWSVAEITQVPRSYAAPTCLPINVHTNQAASTRLIAATLAARYGLRESDMDEGRHAGTVAPESRRGRR